MPGKITEKADGEQISLISYLFDAYPAAGTLSGLTAAACFRIAMAGVVPLVIIQSQFPGPFRFVIPGNRNADMTVQ